ncbi:MAG: single-stranded-DNA-specific exonuclease RecJ [Hyphomicrobiaceae bacterium]
MVAARKARTALAQDAARPFLDIAQSARGLEWRTRLAETDLSKAELISQRHGVPDILGRVIAARGIEVDDTAVFLDPSIKALMPDPSTLKDMDRAAARIGDAIERREKVAVFGDYDVDGACSSALMHRFLSAHDVECRIYIPDRMFEGYGPNPAAIEMLAKDGAKLIVTVDCGTTSFEPLAVAKKVGADVVVIDHHQADERLPDVAAVVNPNRQDDISGLGHLCAAGVVFLTLVAIQRDLRKRGYYTAERSPPDLMSLLDLVALATVCDVVPLLTLNRAYVVKGLQVMKARGNIGLRALGDAAGLDQAPTPYHLGYILGPRINAGGRIGDAGLGSRLLSLDDTMEAQKIAMTLDKLNRERKALETQMLEEAVAEADRLVDEVPDLPVVVVGSDRWHKGVVGLVASRLTDRFRRPSCVIAWASDSGQPMGEGTGSLRSIAGVDIGGAVRAAVADGLLKKGGGHAMAAGLTVTKDKFAALKAYLEAALKSSATEARARPTLEIDGALTPSAATSEFMTLIEKAGPYGQGNAQPRFVFPAHRVKFAKVVGESHVRCVLEAGDGSRIDGVAFRAKGQPLGDMLLGAVNGQTLHVAGNLKRDTWGGRDKLELMIEDVADPRKQS